MFPHTERRPVPAFFSPPSPPPPLPLLTSQLALGERTTRATILANEELPPLHAPRPRRSITLAPTASFSTVRSAAMCSEGDTAGAPRDGLLGTGTKAIVIRHRGASSDDGRNMTPAIEQVLQTTGAGKLRKPEGEVGRPGNGGYNLKAAMGWDDRRYEGLRRTVGRLIKDILDGTKPISEQDPAKLRLVRQEAQGEWPDLEVFEGEWPVLDMCKISLKYSASRARVKEEQQVLDAIVNVRGRTKTKTRTT